MTRKGELNSYQKTQRELDIFVLDIHTNYPTQGYRGIRDTLQLTTGWYASDIAVYKSMKRLNIKGYTRKRKCQLPGGNEHKKHANILNRQFKAEKPMQKIVTDVTYIKHKAKWYYLAVYMDLFNREVLDFELSDTFDNFLIIKPVKRILEEAKKLGHQVLIHSDQGVQYSSRGYTSLLKEHNVIQSMSRAGNPYDNAVIESFFGRFKDVLSSHFKYEKKDDLFDTISQTIHYFNYIKPIRKLNGKQPVPYRLELTA